MIQAAVISFIAALTLGTTAIHMVQTETVPETGEVLSPLDTSQVLVLGTKTQETTPAPSPVITPLPTPKSTPKPKATLMPSPTPATSAQIDGWFNHYANKESIEKELLRKIALCESKYNQFAKNGDYVGLFQFSSGTWVTTRRQMNQNPNPDLRYDAEESIRTAAFRLSTVGLAAWPNCSK